jgi:hypothetical protein
MCVCVCVCVCVCLEQNQQNLVHIWLYVCERILCIYYIYLLSIIFSREDGVRGPHGIHPQGLPVAAAVTFTQIGMQATAR